MDTRAAVWARGHVYTHVYRLPVGAFGPLSPARKLLPQKPEKAQAEIGSRAAVCGEETQGQLSTAPT